MVSPSAPTPHHRRLAVMPNLKTQNAPTEPIYVTTDQCAAMLGVSADTLKTWRLGKGRIPPRLTQGAHWSNPTGRQVLFHRALMIDFVANSHRPELHQKAVVAFLADLPSSRAVSGAGD